MVLPSLGSKAKEVISLQQRLHMVRISLVLHGAGQHWRTEHLLLEFVAVCLQPFPGPCNFRLNPSELDESLAFLRIEVLKLLFYRALLLSLLLASLPQLDNCSV